MKTIDEMIAVMTAYKEGKKIEVYDCLKQIWIDAEHPCWDWDAEDYRVKAESKYRPYANADECFKDVVKHGGWIKDKVNEELFLVGHIDVSGFGMYGLSYFSYIIVFNDYVWADDGSPCGVLEE